MLKEKEIYQKAKKLWTILTDEAWQFDLYFQRPKKGYGYKGGGEYYLYTQETQNTTFEYVLSYSERGEERVIIKSNTFEDIEFELAWYMASEILSMNIKKHRHKFKDGIDSQTRRDMQLEILGRCGSVVYQKAKQRLDN